MSYEEDWVEDPIDDEEEDDDYVPSDYVTLPVGIEKDGKRYRDVIIDEMSGVDDHIVAKKSGGNGAKAMTMVLARCIQEIDGLVQQKKNPEKMIDREITRKMTQVDRDFLISRIYMLAGRDEITLAGECPRCTRVTEHFTLLHKLPVVTWPDENPLSIDIEMEVGFIEKSGDKPVYHKKGILLFPTGVQQELVASLDNAAAMLDAMFAACVRNVGPFEKIDQEQAKRLKSRDRQYLTQKIQTGFPGLKQWRRVKCQCGRKFDIRADLTSFFDRSGRRGKS